MKRFMVWMAIEADDSVASATMMELLLQGPVDDLKGRGFVTLAAIRARELKDGDQPSAVPPEGMLPKMGKA